MTSILFTYHKSFPSAFRSQVLSQVERQSATHLLGGLFMGLFSSVTKKTVCLVAIVRKLRWGEGKRPVPVSTAPPPNNTLVMLAMQSVPFAREKLPPPRDCIVYQCLSEPCSQLSVCTAPVPGLLRMLWSLQMLPYWCTWIPVHLSYTWVKRKDTNALDTFLATVCFRRENSGTLRTYSLSKPA